MKEFTYTFTDEERQGIMLRLDLLVKYLKEVGRAKEVHLRVSCPPIKAPCFYGIDMSTIGELLVPDYEKPLNPDGTKQEVFDKIAKDIGADSLIYNTIPG